MWAPRRATAAKTARVAAALGLRRNETTKRQAEKHAEKHAEKGFVEAAKVRSNATAAASRRTAEIYCEAFRPGCFGWHDKFNY